MIALSNVRFSYPNSKFTLSIKRLSIPDGQNIAILGASGSGKTTLLRLISGRLLLKRGTVKIDGQRMSSSTFPTLSRKIGAVWQLPSPSAHSVMETVSSSPASCGFPPFLCQELAVYALKSLHILHLSECSCRELSPIQAHAVELAAALAKQPSLLLFDDPTGLLSCETRLSFYTALQFLPHTKVISSHDPEDALRLCSRVLLLHNGELLADGDPHTLLKDRVLMRKAGLLLPQRFWHL